MIVYSASWPAPSQEETISLAALHPTPRPVLQRLGQVDVNAIYQWTGDATPTAV